MSPDPNLRKGCSEYDLHSSVHLGLAKLSSQLAAVRHWQGNLRGRTEGIGFDLRNEAMLRILTSDIVKSREFEGETLDKDQLGSSITKGWSSELAD